MCIRDSFITIIGLVDAGFVRMTGNSGAPLGLGIGGQLAGRPVFVFCIGLLVMIALHGRGVPGAILIGIIIATILSVVIESIVEAGPAFVDGKPSPKGWNCLLYTSPSPRDR